MTNRIGETAYQLALPSSDGIHNVFYVSQLKLCPTTTDLVKHPHLAAAELLLRGEPEFVLARKMVERGNLAATKVLVKWKNSSVEATTWEFYHNLLKQFYHNLVFLTMIVQFCLFFCLMLGFINVSVYVKT